MNSQDKARELVLKFYPEVRWKLGQEDCIKRAKNCALITVDEILFSNNTIFETNIPHECWKYWQEVKQEIEKL
jgi:hypothetical protein